MSFLDNYLSKHKLEPISDQVKTDLGRLEEKLNDQIVSVKKGETFETVITDYSPQLISLIERFRIHVSSMDLTSLSGVFSSFRFVISIGTEAYQIIEGISDKVVKDDLPEDEKKDAKINFGKNIVYFVWKTVDPLREKFKWLPLKGTIEKKLVMWVADMGLHAAVNLFAAQTSVYSSKPVVIRKALP